MGQIYFLGRSELVVMKTTCRPAGEYAEADRDRLNVASEESLTMERLEYVPGVCNIGPKEIVRRRVAGWAGLSSTAALWVLFTSLRADSAWYLTLFFPAALAAAGFLQAKTHFCASFGMRGLFNVGPEAGKTETVMQAEFRALDRRKAIRILLSSAVIGLVVSLASLAVHQATG